MKVSRVELRKIEPPENLIRAMNLQMTAERERRATVMKAEGEREATVKVAEGNKASLILAAEGRQEAAQRDAAARERLAQAEATATRVVAQAVAEGGETALRYFISDRYVAAFQAHGGLAEQPAGDRADGGLRAGRRHHPGAVAAAGSPAGAPAGRRGPVPAAPA